MAGLFGSEGAFVHTSPFVLGRIKDPGCLVPVRLIEAGGIPSLSCAGDPHAGHLFAAAARAAPLACIEDGRAEIEVLEPDPAKHALEA